jgi:phosphohistidine phosphatase SixA
MSGVLLIRHASTGAKLPEGWRSIPLDATGRTQAAEVGNWLAERRDRLPVEVTRVVSSDLNRAKETANAIATALGINEIETRSELRAFDKDRESRNTYKKRSDAALRQLRAETGVAAVIHRSLTVHLANRLGLASSASDPNFTRSLLEPSGVLALDGNTLIPLYKTEAKNWSGTSGIVHELPDSQPDRPSDTDDDDRRYRALRRFAMLGPFEYRNGRPDLTPIWAP